MTPGKVNEDLRRMVRSTYATSRHLRTVDVDLDDDDRPYFSRDVDRAPAPVVRGNC